VVIAVVGITGAEVSVFRRYVGLGGTMVAAACVVKMGGDPYDVRAVIAFAGLNYVLIFTVHPAAMTATIQPSTGTISALFCSFCDYRRG
jgi:hypothetical protein